MVFGKKVAIFNREWGEKGRKSPVQYFIFSDGSPRIVWIPDELIKFACNGGNTCHFLH